MSKVKKQKKKFVHYSFEDKAKYHRNICNLLSHDDKTFLKQVYSRSWLNGVGDDHAKQNLKAVNNELKETSKLCDKNSFQIMDLLGYKNGLKERIRYNKKYID